MFTHGRLVCKGADIENYHTQDSKPGEPEYVLSCGSLTDFAACPARWIAGYKHGDGTNKKWRQLLLCRHLTPSRYEQRYAVRPDNYEARVLRCPGCNSDSEAKICRKCGLTRHSTLVQKPWAGGADYCKKWMANVEQKKQIVVKLEDALASATAVERLDADPAIKQLRDDSDILVWLTGRWKDPDTGLSVPVRTLIPYAPKEGSVYDYALAALKTTPDASHGAWRRVCYYSHSHVRAAWCLDLWLAATGHARSEFLFVISEGVEPFEPARRSLSPTFLQLGRRTYETILAAYCKCLATGVWPSYDVLADGKDAWTTVETEPWMHQDENVSAGSIAPVEPAATNEPAKEAA